MRQAAFINRDKYRLSTAYKFVFIDFGTMYVAPFPRYTDIAKEKIEKKKKSE